MTHNDNRITPFRKTRRRAYQALEEDDNSTQAHEAVTPNVSPADKVQVVAAKDHLARQKEAEAIVNRAMWLARGAGVVPLPLLDFVALMAIQMTMLTQLSHLYGVDFSKNRAKKIVISLSASANTALTGGFIMYNVGKLAPGFAAIGGLLTMPLIGGSLTYAVGKTFIKHYELGGTLLDFDPQSTRAYFQTQFQRASK